MSGNSGVLHTGHWLVDCRGTAADEASDDGDSEDTDSDNGEPADGGITAPGSGATLGAVTSAEVYFTEMDLEEIDAYIATGEPLHCAGSFTIDGFGGAFIRKVDGDPHTVVGLSISTLRSLLGQANVRITELWPAQ
jgi:septum formation protein